MTIAAGRGRDECTSAINAVWTTSRHAQRLALTLLTTRRLLPSPSRVRRTGCRLRVNWAMRSGSPLWSKRSRFGRRGCRIGVFPGTQFPCSEWLLPGLLVGGPIRPERRRPNHRGIPARSMSVSRLLL